jgi:tetratricopeptide (TPR) repeat protein
MLLACLLVASPGSAEGRQDPWLGEALFHAYQHDWFAALERLDTEIAQHHRIDEPELDSLHPFIGHAEFSVGDFELEYRMHHAAGRAMRAVLEADVPDPVRNDAAYRLARLHFQKGQPTSSLTALDGMRGDVPVGIRDDVAYLRSNLLLATGRSGEAVDVLRGLQGSSTLRGFSAYNLGIALLQDGRTDDAIRQLDRAGKIRTSDATTLAIRDKSNLVLGTLRFEAEEFDEAQRSLDRVRLAGPFSNQALLRAGWSDASADNYQRALVPWKLLVDRSPADIAVQESWLALPYAYGKLNIHGRAAVLYGKAIDSFQSELSKVDASIANIREGAFLEALVREEMRRDADWVIRLRSLPDAPETFYLIELMAGHEFQTSLQNYLDLEDLRRKLVSWKRSLASFDDLIAKRAGYYEPRLPGMDSRFRELDARMRLRLEQRDQFETRLKKLLVAPRSELLATAQEQAAGDRLTYIEAQLERRDSSAAKQMRARVARLRGVLHFQLEAEYADRLTETHRHLRELNVDIEELSSRHESFVRARQAASHSHEGYRAPVRRLRTRIAEAQDRVDMLMKRQGHHLEQVAIHELVARRDLLESYQNRARFAFADSYDRAAKGRADAEALREQASLWPGPE